MESLAVKMMEKATESDRLWSMLEHVFVDLAETCIMGNRQGKTTSSNPPIDVIALGMGDDSIWHGYLDALVDVVPLRISSSDDSDDDYSSESSSGGKSIPEAKVRLVYKVRGVASIGLYGLEPPPFVLVGWAQRWPSAVA